MFRYIFLALVLASCSTSHDQGDKTQVKQIDSVNVVTNSISIEQPPVPVNDTLNTIAGLIAGNLKTTAIYSHIIRKESYAGFSDQFSKRWKQFDTARVTKLTMFRAQELDRYVKPETTLFYPFSGPDILHAILFFPNVEKYVLLGLEPVGSLPDFTKYTPDSLEDYYDTYNSLQNYYGTLNTSLNAILNFSFFRTESMKNDLRNTDVDGTLHLLFLFLNRTGNAIVSAKPITLDSLGNVKDVASFVALKTKGLKTKGVQIEFKTPTNQIKELQYFSVNASDYSLKYNKGFMNYLSSLNHFNTYLKGASYLLHKPTFSTVRSFILDGSETIIQDDSGVGIGYFPVEKWNFHLYGKYSKPIDLFARHYQPLLDSMYRKPGSTKPLDFGLGYNYRDKNSNFMIVTRH